MAIWAEASVISPSSWTMRFHNDALRRGGLESGQKRVAPRRGELESGQLQNRPLAEQAPSPGRSQSFDAQENRRVLAEMRRVLREGATVVDLRRSRLLLALLHLILPLLRSGAVTREDGYLSAKRAWAIPEAPATPA